MASKVVQYALGSFIFESFVLVVARRQGLWSLAMRNDV